jgi:hypothetical protein
MEGQMRRRLLTVIVAFAAVIISARDPLEAAISGERITSPICPSSLRMAKC